MLGDVLQLTAVGSGQGQAILHTLHFRNILDPADSLGNEQNLIDSWQTGGQPTFLATMPSWYTLQARRAAHVFNGVLRATVEEGSSGTGGGFNAGGSESLAPWLSAMIRERSALKGKRYAGRFYLPAGFEICIAGTAITDLLLGYLQSYCNAMMTVYGPNGTNPNWRLVTFSRTRSLEPGATTDNTTAQVISLSPSAVLTTTRSRRA